MQNALMNLRQTWVNTKNSASQSAKTHIHTQF